MNLNTGEFVLGKFAVLLTVSSEIARDKNDLIANFAVMLEKNHPQGAATIKQEPETETEKLIIATEQSQNVLISATSVFPFVLFPDTISIDRQKITITHRSAFRTSQAVSVQIIDIQNIEADIGPLFGSVSLTSLYFTNNVQQIQFLHRKEAKKVHELLQGSIIAHRMKIKTEGIDNRQLIILLTDLGQSSMKSK